MKNEHFSRVLCISNLHTDAKIKKIEHLSFPCFLSPSNDAKQTQKYFKICAC